MANTRQPARRIGSSWTPRVRRINGTPRQVKVRKNDEGSEQVRIIGFVNTTDSGGRSHRRKS